MLPSAPAGLVAPDGIGTSIGWSLGPLLHIVALSSPADQCSGCQPLLSVPQLRDQHLLGCALSRSLPGIAAGDAVSC